LLEFPASGPKLSPFDHRCFLIHDGPELPAVPADAQFLTWSSNEDTNLTPLANGTVAMGDHVLIHAAFSHSEKPPGINITHCGIWIECRTAARCTGTLVNPGDVYYPDRIPITDFAWEWVSGIRRGDNVTAVLNFTNADCSMMIWWADTDNSTWDFANNLMGNQTTTENKPEAGSFVVDRDGTLAVGIYDYSGEKGNYTLSINTASSLNASSFGDEVTIDTYALGNRSGLSVVAVGYAETGPAVAVTASNVSVCNLFAPRIIDIRIDGLGALKNVSWTVVDRNADESHVSEVWLSADNGLWFYLLASNFTESYYLWDSTGYMARDTYVFRVRTRDSSGLYCEARSASFIHPSPSVIFVNFGAPENISYEEGSTGHYIGWRPNVLGPFEYTVFRNGIDYSKGTWSSSVTQTGGHISVNVDGLTVGVHAFRIVTASPVYWGEDTVHVIVTQATSASLEWAFSLPSALVTGACIGVIVVFSAAIIRERAANR